MAKQLNQLQFKSRKDLYSKIEKIVSKYNVRIDWDASPITGLTWEGEPDNGERVQLVDHRRDVKEYLEYRESFLALLAAETEAVKAEAEAAPTELTLEEQIAEIRKVEAARRRHWEEEERRWHDENLSSIHRPEPSVDAVRAKYPEAAKELDARRAKAAEEAKKARAERVSKIDPWNL